MSDYEAIGVYAGFALIVFAIGMIWRYNRDAIKKRFHLLNYHPKGDDSKTTHPV
jgi:hypothetical protein